MYIGERNFSVSQLSMFHRVNLEGPNRRIWFDLMGLTETSVAPSPTLMLLMTDPVGVEQSLYSNFH